MENQGPTIPNTPNPAVQSPGQQQLDPSIVHLAQAISKTETHGQLNPYTAPGGSGEYGAYQYTAPTWAADSQKYLGQSVPLEQSTPAQQDEVAYKKIQDLGKQGYTPAQIASIWNSGNPDPTGNVGTNKFGVKYNTPEYVKAVGDAYDQLQGGNENPTTTPTASTVGNTQVQNPAQKDDLLNNPITRAIMNIFPGKQIGQDIGTLAGYLTSPNKDTYDLSAPSPLQAIADTAQGALTVGLPDAGEGMGLLGRLGTNTALGAGIGLTNAIANKTSAASGLLGGATAGLAGGALGETIGGVLGKVLPTRLTQNVLRGGDADAIETAMSKGAWSLNDLVTQNNTASRTLSSQIKEILGSDDYATNIGHGSKSFEDTLASFPNSEMSSTADVANSVKNVVPGQAKLVDKVLSGDASLLEKNTLRSAIDQNTYKQSGDLPKLTFDKQISNTLANKLRTEVQTVAPETQQPFEDLSKELNLRKVLARNTKRLGAGKAISLLNLTNIAGAIAGGIPGYAAATVAQEALKSPTADLTAANLLKMFGGAGTLLSKGSAGILPTLLNKKTNVAQ